MLYTPYIEWAMEHIQRIYSWNEQVDFLRIENICTDRPYSTMELYETKWYDFNTWLRMYYEEKNEYTEAKLANDVEEQVDALIDQFVVAIGEIRKCSLSDDYQHIDFWEDQANNAYGWIDSICFEIAEKILASDEPIAYANISSLWDAIMHKAITEVLDALDTRFGADCYVNNEWKFVKSTDYRKPDLSFLKK